MLGFKEAVICMPLSDAFRHKREEVTGENCIMRSFMVFIPHQLLFRLLSRIRWVGNVACIRMKRDAYRVLLGKPEGKGPLGRPKSR
jgi:hypothetical protein